VSRRSRACDSCLARSWLLARLAGHLELARAKIEPVLALPDGELIESLGGAQRAAVRREHASFDADAARGRAAGAGLELLCRCDPRYPPRLEHLEAPPAVLHVAGGLDEFTELAATDPVAIVGARKASSYGLEVARSLARGLAAAELCVVSGMAFGVDGAAHAGALTVAGGTVAILPCSAERAYPVAKRALYRQIRERGAVLAELPPGTAARRWMFPARNRIIAALSALTVVVEAGQRSGALLTAGIARALGRAVGAVPGQVTSPLAEGPNGLLASGALLVRSPQDVLDHLFGAGVRTAGADSRPPLEPQLAALLEAIAAGQDTERALRSTGCATTEGLAALAQLEIAGYLRRGPGGRFTAVP
jgi:DNA processing protein